MIKFDVVVDRIHSQFIHYTPNIRFCNLGHTKKDLIRCLDTTYEFYNFIMYHVLYLL